MNEAAAARATLARGSKSFAAASTLLPPALRDDVARLYAWCRHADDVIDGQDLGHGERVVPDPAARLAELRRQTDTALAGASVAPVFAGFAAVARRHGISRSLAHDHLDGFAMDVDGRTYATIDELAAYCYGVAGAVGVMMALVMGVAPEEADTLDRACDLGLAFQMTNIARDVVADAAVGRLYLPTTWLAEAGVPPYPDAVRAPAHAPAVHTVAVRLVHEAEPYYRSARVGLARLPLRARWAVASASAVYREIGVRRQAAGPAGLAERVGTTKAEKLRLIAGALGPTLSRPRATPSRGGLWTRPRHAGDGTRP
ncbi:phytoene/squalene synthase family protein [Acuticoccus sp. I52.16.1]|uniref:phytoene/squalene synthase family protein n=1 Tax=Acuticoccus sp. I52.16.1 TaxID=2928472 RepID=UPI001FD21904|nr:phytoene/squalene synthase family protein [Acuticoccus sp. I52.16.1]UOM33442.1 phytoene/squalene synthase family protein [Acuticoccus sp. I52.16.1]